MAGVSFAVHTAYIRGSEALPVTAEVSLAGGIPGITLVGMPDKAVLEARYRVRSALGSTGYELPRLHLTVNLSPGELKKTGTGFDLPIAVAILASTRQIPQDELDRCLFVGELALDGSVGEVRGCVAYALLAKSRGLTLVCAPGVTVPPSLVASVVSLTSLTQLRGGVRCLSYKPQDRNGDPGKDQHAPLDYGDVYDQEIAKRAFVIAAAGSHGLLMVGPPGAGKTMLAKRMPTIMAPLSDDEEIEARLIHSLVEEDLPPGEHIRPFRAPHHSISIAGMVGGGRPVLPGEISLAHRGVLFLDELPEFATNVLQSLRQPLEDKEVRIVRVDGTYRFPCDFLLVAAANPCPCGHLGDPGHMCRCSPGQVERYQGRIGGPLMDRIDLVVDVARPKSDRVIQEQAGLSSADMAEQVRVGREFASWRKNKDHWSGSGVVGAAKLDSKASAVLEGIATRKALGGRGITRLTRVARTVADLAERDRVSADDIIEASTFRARDSL